MLHPLENHAVNDALRAACANGQLSEVRRILADPHANPSFQDDTALRYACLYEHVEVVKLLLADPRVNPSARNDRVIKHACLNGLIELMKVLLANARVDPSADNDYCVRFACSNGQIEVVKLLLTDPRVNPSADDNDALHTACRNGYVEVVQLLLADPRVTPSLDVIKDALKEADEGRHIEVVILLVNTQPQLMLSLYGCEVGCVIDGPLRQELNRWQDRSACSLLLCVKRIESNQTAARVSDVLREVIDVFARFHVSLYALPA